MKLSRFRLTVKYTPGKDNVVADGLSRWAYPASQAGPDVCWHGTQQDLEEMEKILADEKADEWKVPEEMLALSAPELPEALVAGTVVNFVLQGDITLSEDAEWRGTVEVPQDLWEANNQMNLSMLGETVIPTFGITAQSVKPGEVCIRA